MRPCTFDRSNASTKPNQQPPKTSSSYNADAERARSRRSAAEQSLFRLKVERSRKSLDRFGFDRKIEELETKLRQSRETDLEDDRKNAEQASVLTLLNLWGTREAPEVTERRKRERIERNAGQRIWSHQLDSLKGQQKRMNEEIAAINLKLRAEEIKLQKAKRDEQLAEELLKQQRDSEARKKAAAEAEEKARQWRQSQEAASRAEAEAAAQRRKEEREARAREALDKARRAREAEQERKEREARAAAEKPKKQKNRKKAPAKDQRQSRATAEDGGGQKPQHEWGSCNHRGFWKKEQGAALCTSCFVQQRLFVFHCPKCGIAACANCRDGLKKI